MARRLLLLQFGAEGLSHGLSLRGGDGLLGWEPLTGLLVETAVGWVRFDSGMAWAADDDPASDASEAAATDAFGEHDQNSDPPHLHPMPPEAAGWT